MVAPTGPATTWSESSGAASNVMVVPDVDGSPYCIVAVPAVFGADVESALSAPRCNAV